MRRIGYLASRLEANGIFVITSFVSPYRDGRLFARKLCKRFIEVYVSTPLEVAEKRDIKGLYAKARRNEIKNFTGVSEIYETPQTPEISINTTNRAVEECVQEILNYLEDYSRK